MEGELNFSLEKRIRDPRIGDLTFDDFKVSAYSNGTRIWTGKSHEEARQKWRADFPNYTHQDESRLTCGMATDDGVFIDLEGLEDLYTLPQKP